MTDSAQASASNWYDALPTPSATLDNGLSTISVDELYEKVKANPAPNSRDFLVVDVRRTDFDVGYINGATNIPAHSAYQTLDGLIPIFTKYENVIFHCQSSKGRGPKVAGWVQDRLNQQGIKETKAVVLTGGIKAWNEKYLEDSSVTTKL